MKLVLIEWEDASIADEGTWVNRADLEAPKVVIFRQVGWLLGISPTEVVLTAAVGDDLIAPRDRIPLGMVRSIVELDPGKRVALPKRKRTAKKDATE